MPRESTGRVKSKDHFRSRRQEAPTDLSATLKHLVFPVDILPSDNILQYLANKLSEHYDIYPKDRSELRMLVGTAKRNAGEIPLKMQQPLPGAKSGHLKSEAETP